MNNMNNIVNVSLTAKETAKRSDLKDELSIKKKTAKAELALGVIQQAVADINLVVETEEGENEVTQDDLDMLARSLYQSINSMYDTLYNMSARIEQTQGQMWNMLADHIQTYLHLPAVDSAELLQRIIEKIGMDKSWTIQKSVIYASDGKPSFTRLEIPIK